MSKIFLALLIFISCYAKEFSVATYNVENLFDLQYNGDEYKEYIPYTHLGWNEKAFRVKIQNISKVIKELNADILVLQEIENDNVLGILNSSLKTQSYQYCYIPKKSGIKSALLSKYPILKIQMIYVKDFPRPIHKIHINVDNKELTLFINHWPSYNNGNQIRVEFAKSLQKSIDKNSEFIFLGDFNAPFVKQHNNWGESVSKVTHDARVYNLWYELPYKQRYSHSFYKKKNALDHMIISKDMFDKRGIEYKDRSFKVFRPTYLVDTKGNPKRWKLSKEKKHLAKGFSDHLPLVAYFETKEYTRKKTDLLSVKELLQTPVGKVDIILKNITLKDTSKYGVTIEDSSKKSIFIYKPDFKLRKNRVYTLHIKNIALYKGKKEITLARVIK